MISLVLLKKSSKVRLGALLRVSWKSHKDTLPEIKENIRIEWLKKSDSYKDF